MKNTPTVESLNTQIAYMMSIMKGTKNFKIRDYIVKGISFMANEIEKGDIPSAIDAGEEILRAGRGFLSTFYHNSVLPPMKDGKDVVPPFSVEVLSRQEAGFDRDVVEKLEELRAKFEKAVVEENNICFSRRMEAYNAMREGIATADAKQKQLDRTRFETERQRLLTQGVLSKSAPRNASPVRLEMIQARVKGATELRALIGK
jgi:hypothetical protein